MPSSFLKIFIGIIQSLFILNKYKADLVVGFGGYSSIPSILAAKILKIKIIIHEQNAIMGRTNRLLSYLTNNIALTFKHTVFAKKSAIHTGIPIRKKKKYKTEKSDTKKLLIVGGSQGAKVFGELVPHIISNFTIKTKSKILVIHQVRIEDREKVSEKYKKMKIKFILKEFFDDIYQEFDKADIIISRCGASTLAEINLFRKFSLLFPLPSAMNNHQYHNALEFAKTNECIIVNEKEINIDKISKKIEKRMFFKKKSYKLKLNRNKSKSSLTTLIKKLLIKDV